MEILKDSTIVKNTLSKISLGFKLFAKEKLQQQLNKLNPSSALDPDKIFANVELDRAISSETLTEALLKKNRSRENPFNPSLN